MRCLRLMWIGSGFNLIAKLQVLNTISNSQQKTPTSEELCAYQSVTAYQSDSQNFEKNLRLVFLGFEFFFFSTNGHVGI